jgi:hypothetical protein
MDGYRKGWALRYLREAKAELEAARKIPYMAPSLVLEAIRKARAPYTTASANQPSSKFLSATKLGNLSKPMTHFCVFSWKSKPLYSSWLKWKKSMETP